MIKAPVMLMMSLVLTGCLLGTATAGLTPVPSPQPVIIATSTPIPGPTASPTATPYPHGLSEALDVMSGICFEYALDQAGSAFVIRDAQQHIRFYEQADASGLCRQPVERQPFDFDGGRILAGLWSAGSGCKARHEIITYEQDDSTRSLNIALKFITSGDCPYELVRPWWVSITDLSSYDIGITVTETEHHED